MNDRVQNAKVVIKHKGYYQQVIARTNSNLWVDKTANEQFRLSDQILRKMSKS